MTILLLAKIIKNNLTKTFFISSLLLSISLLFIIQFKVDILSSELSRVENEIVSYQEEIKILDIEWVYLTRPERLRILAKKYLKNNGYMSVSQIRDKDSLKSYYLSKYKKYQEKKMASNTNKSQL